jgi:hypothetical protein
MFQSEILQSSKWLEMWSVSAAEHIARMEQMSAQLDRMQAEGLARAQAAVDEGARLLKETLRYNAELAAEWRKISADAMKKAAGVVAAPKAQG